MSTPFPSMTILDQILKDVADEVAHARCAWPAAEIRSMLPDAPLPRPFAEALGPEFCLIAEIKERSPSVGAMEPANVRSAPAVYEASQVVKAISVLTNQTHFGMDIVRLREIRSLTTKPVLRKDFMIDEYQVREARAFGADAVLLMANVLDAARLAGFYELARELGMEALFEVHSAEELALLPPGARVVGINSRKFKTQSGFVGSSGRSEQDFSIEYEAFKLVDRLPSGCLRVAESGLSPGNVATIRSKFQAALVGTSLLRAPEGVEACLREFEDAIHR